MITSIENRTWANDVSIPDPYAAGLPVPSVVRCAKIATIDAARAEVRGRVDPERLTEVRARLSATLLMAKWHSAHLRQGRSWTAQDT